MKEVIFHFFPFVRFLGLGLKILFHKNKEIERMLLKKTAFSLMSLITIIALAFVVSPAMAAPFSVVFSYDEAENVDGREVAVTMKFDKVVSLADVRAHHVLTPTADTKKIEVIVVQSNFVSMTYRMKSDGTGVFEDVTDSTPRAVNDFGPVIQKDLDLTTSGTQSDGKTFTFTIPMTELARDDAATATVEPFANKVYLSITGDPADTVDGEGTIGVPSLDPGDLTTSAPGTLTIDLRTVAPQDRDTPAVVSIQRLRPGSQTVVAAFQEAAVTGEFNVRVVITEEPKSLDLKNDKFGEDVQAKKLVAIAGGVVTDLVIGAPFTWHGGTTGTDPPVPNQAQTVKPHPIEGRYNHDGVDTLSLGDTVNAGDDYGPLVGVPDGLDEVLVPFPTSSNGMYWQARVKVTPHRRADMVKLSIKGFHDKDSPPNHYTAHQTGLKPNGRERLDLEVNIPAFDLEDGYKVILPHDNGAQITYAGGPGNYILAKNKDGSSINYFREAGSIPRRENVATEQTPAQLLYNVRAAYAAPALPADTEALPNLETFLANNGTIHLVSYDEGGTYVLGDAYISEIMWGTDASLADVSHSNWIEIRNGTGGAIGIKAGIWALWFYEAHETPATAYRADSPYEGPIGQAGTIIDAIGTKDGTTGRSWSIADKGQSGRTNVDTARTDFEVLTPTTPLHSMYRVMVAGVPGDGTMASSWMQATGPSVNLKIGRENAYIATPGADEFDTPDETAEAAATAQATADAAAASAAAEQTRIATTGTIPTNGQIYISEIMFAGGGRLPQWIEIANGSRSEEINLSGWTLTVDNAVADADVSVGATATFAIPDGTMISMSGQDDTPSTILVVTEKGRNNFTGAKAAGQVVNLAEDNEVELILAGVVTGKYTLLSGMAFMVTLAPPEPPKTTPPTGETVAAKATRQAAEKTARARRVKATDKAGNLGADGAAAWVLPMNEDGARSSIIRKHVQVTRGPAAPEVGMMMEDWVLASDTSFAQVTHIRAASYYGAANDVGTPGFRPGGALPVELSHFSPARDKVTGAVVITWSTQSELNNAGFFIKRSQQADGRVQSHQRDNGRKVQARPVRSSSIRITIQLLNPMSYTTTKLKMYLSMGTVRRLPAASA